MTSILTAKGYSVLKASVTAVQLKTIQKELTVLPAVAPQYAGGSSPFTLYMESASRWYLPVMWGLSKFGPPASDTRPEGDPLRSELKFICTLRPEQLPIQEAVQKNDYNGIVSVPCGYGKTKCAIAFAVLLGKRFIVVVHKEFLMAQWKEELESSVPGIKIGKIQGEKCEIGPEYDCAIAMIQTLCSRTYVASTFAGFGFSIFDECHHLGAEHFSRALQQVGTKRRLGLSATPDRADGLRRVFEWFLGPIVYQVKRRDADMTVAVRIFRYSTTDEPYCTTPLNWKGEVVRARFINLISEDKERTKLLATWIAPVAKEEYRQTLLLSDRREHLDDFKAEFIKHGITSIGHYVGGMKQVDLDTSAKCRIVLGTFAMAAEGMNIPTLNTIVLATPKSNIEQSIGRVLRQKPEERKCAPLILDVLDAVHTCCNGQYARRRKFYRSCGYQMSVWDQGVEPSVKKKEVEVEEEPVEEASPSTYLFED
jgi:superfamily II DNA or RNA helicase